MCSLPGSVHIPLADMEKGDLPATLTKAGLSLEKDLLSRSAANEPVFVICRRGIFSLDAARILRSHGVSTAVSVRGGLAEWAARVDTAFPRY